MLKGRSLGPLLFALPVAVLALGTWAFAEFGPPIELPNGWRIAAPPASLQTVGTLPTGILLSRDGTRAYELEAGHQKPVLRVLDARTLAVQSSVPLGNGFGAPVSDGGNGVWIANTGFGEQISHVDLQAGHIDRSISLPVPFFPVAIARAPAGSRMAVAGDFANAVAIVDSNGGALLQEISVGRHPAALAYAADGRTLYVADRAESFVDAIDLAAGRVRARIRVGLHPSALLRNGTRLYVADSDDDDVAVIDLAAGRVVQRARLPFALSGVVGDSPNSLTRDGDRLYVTCGAANAVAVFRVTAAGLAPLGAIPTGWYPTALAVESGAHALLIADGKGESSHTNVNYRFGSFSGTDYIANEIVGAIRRVPIPTDAQLRAGLATVESLGAPYARTAPPPNPIVRAGGPIKHVIYIIKENRTYDQVLGDVAGADGDKSLVMFGQAVTPNQHALVARFGVFDRFFCDAHVSADGHSWSTAAFATDYLEKMWPPDYDRRRGFYDFEDGAQASVPHNGYLWDDVRRNHLTLRDYGEFVTGGAIDEGDNTTRPPMSTMEPGLVGRIDPHFAGFDTRLPDMQRFAEWKREFDAFEQRRTLPQLEVVRLGRDHTAGTSTGQNTPQAMVADNDLAVGKVVEAVSHSADWASTAIFILEDDAQDGPDHVDEQRSTLYIASPYAAGGLQHEHYTTSSVLRTIELLLGLPPMTPYDAGARPLFAAFTTTPDLAPFDALPATTDLEAKNKPVAYRAADSNVLDFAHEDRVPDAVLNDILWHAVRGNTPEPPFGAFDASRHRPTAPDSDDS